METIIYLTTVLKPYGVWCHLVIFSILLACGFGFPMPEDIPLLVSGTLAGLGIINYQVANIVCMLGVLVGDGIIFFLGRKMGTKIKGTYFFKKVFTPSREKKVSGWFNKHGEKTIFFARFLPGLRMPIFLSAGVYRVAPWKFFLFDGTAALISVPAWIYIAFVASENIELLATKMKQLQHGIYGLIGGLLFLIVAFYFIKKKISKVTAG